MVKTPRIQQRNRILAHLSEPDLARLQPHLEPIELPTRKMLEAAGRRIDQVYFIERGFASVVANGHHAAEIEVGLVGCEGVTGLAVIFGADRTPNRTYMQAGGAGQRIAASELRRAMEQSATLRSVLLCYAHVFMIQTTQTALSNASGLIEERLARWLLMANDRIEEDGLLLTHEFLGVMLGVRRSGVTLALNYLKKNGLITLRRGAISIVDREGLKKSSNGSYGAPEAEFQRLFG